MLFHSTATSFILTLDTFRAKFMSSSTALTAQRTPSRASTAVGSVANMWQPYSLPMLSCKRTFDLTFAQNFSNFPRCLPSRLSGRFINICLSIMVVEWSWSSEDAVSHDFLISQVSSALRQGQVIHFYSFISKSM